MIYDALTDEDLDTLFLLSSDSDFVPAIRSVHEARKKVVVVSPNADYSKELAAEADGIIVLSPSMYKQCQLPDAIDTGEKILTRPEGWKDSA